MILTYLFILIAKIVEVSLMTVRVVLITKGERKIGALIAFFEVSIWVTLVSTVLSNVTEDPLKVVVYALGFSLGNYLGSRIEEKIGIGLSEVQIIVKQEHGTELASKLREDGYAVTVLEGEGKNLPRNILILFIQRRRTKWLIRRVNEIQDNAVITIKDTKPVYGGYGMLRK